MTQDGRFPVRGIVKEGGGPFRLSTSRSTRMATLRGTRLFRPSSVRSMRCPPISAGSGEQID